MIEKLQYEVRFGCYGAEYQEAKRRGLTNWPKGDPDLWWVTIRHPGGREYSFPFATAEALRDDRIMPTAKEKNVFLLALASIVKDTLFCEGVGNFEEFCSELGYDPEDPKSKKRYRNLKESAQHTKKLLGEDFDKVVKELEELELL